MGPRRKNKWWWLILPRPWESDQSSNKKQDHALRCDACDYCNLKGSEEVYVVLAQDMVDLTPASC